MAKEFLLRILKNIKIQELLIFDFLKSGKVTSWLNLTA